MSAHSLACTLALLAAISGSACDGIGRPLVGHKQVDKRGGQDSLCVLAPSCEDDRIDDLASEIAPFDVSPVDLKACGAVLSQCVPERDALGVPTNRACLTAWPADDAGAVSNSVYGCTGITLENHDPDVKRTAIAGVELHQTSVNVWSETPLRVELDGAIVDDVIFRLEGPVTLRLSNTRSLEHVRVLGSSSGKDRQRVEVSGVDGKDLSISADYGLFSGSVVLDHGSVESVRVSAISIETSDIALDHATLESEVLDAQRTSLEYAMLTFDDGRLDACNIDRAQITDCRSLAISTGQLEHMRIPVCSDPLRVYGARIDTAFIDGEIEADLALFEDVVFGLHETTNLLAWDSQIFTSNFCERTSTVRLAGSVFVQCPSCTDARRLITCADSNAVHEISTSDCAAFLDPRECGNAVPERPQPP